MRREIFRAGRGEALALLRRAPTVHLATTTPEGAPVLRALDAAVLEDGVWFHGARAGEKARCLGRAAVVSAEELVAHLPSWMADPVRACPATTLYRSVQAHGTLEELTDSARKAEVLSALMARWQPEGRYRPLRADDPLYAGELRGILVLGVRLGEALDGKWKLLQNRTPEQIGAALEGLWARGAPGDVAAIEAVRAANPHAPEPSFLAAGIPGVRLQVALGEADAPAVRALLAGEYWWEGEPLALAGPSHLASTAWVGARDADGALVASARAMADPRHAWIYDVVVAPAWRGRGLGKRLVALLLDHPAVRRTRFVRLVTADAQGLYARFGFVDAAGKRRFGTSTEMVLVRDPPAGADAGAP
ncbi:GCN5-related N-acetyltransferase [Anaeromyxobacter dehalogenans 2CP-1]|uniref:GCN5-related N-acetyltransferase n=1 Tax=Anaeromyxobacter dehalogenans (strain ATCC BAA-258 / DSM 21875 / 2CP-1) TaxID=455488 RepID=B8J7S8_ANAD2|nr:GNAT family N-acetyltransferase [Anaeromyxobacter dehalogenans]ACL63420.1 GCN5-related N-acetyltransferase [Anaeromyxobacter dehalogenans 2CP-1]